MARRGPRTRARRCKTQTTFLGPSGQHHGHHNRRHWHASKRVLHAVLSRRGKVLANASEDPVHGTVDRSRRRVSSSCSAASSRACVLVARGPRAKSERGMSAGRVWSVAGQEGARCDSPLRSIAGDRRPRYAARTRPWKRSRRTCAPRGVPDGIRTLYSPARTAWHHGFRGCRVAEGCIVRGAAFDATPRRTEELAGPRP